MEKADKEAIRKQREEYRAYRKEVYGEYPEVERFEAMKARMGKCLLLYGLILLLVRVFGLGVPFARGFFYNGFGIEAIFLLAAMGTKWRMACALYLLAGLHLTSYIGTFTGVGVTSWEAVSRAYPYGSAQHSLAVGANIFSWIYMALILAFAVWLTVVPSHRRYADKADELNQEINAYMINKAK